ADAGDTTGLRRVHPYLLQRHHRITLAACEQDGDGCARHKRGKGRARHGEGARVLRETPTALCVDRTAREPLLARGDVHPQARDASIASQGLLASLIPAHRACCELPGSL